MMMMMMGRRRRRIPQFNQGNRGLSQDLGSVWCPWRLGASRSLCCSLAAPLVPGCGPSCATVGPASFGALALSQALGPSQGASLSSLAVRPGLRLRPMPPGARVHGEYARLSDPPVLRCCNFEWRSRLVVVFSFVSCGLSGTRGTS